MSKKIVKCKVCGEEIAKSAKVCPHCGAKNKKHTVLGVFLVIIGVLLISSAFGNTKEAPRKVEDEESSTDTIQSEQQPSELQQSTFGVGEKVELNDISVTLVKVSENSGGNYMTPSDGKVFVVCEFDIENNSDEDIAISSIMSFDTYIDDYASSLSLSAMLSTDQPQLDGSIAAGKKMNGVIGYEADPDWSSIEIRFKPDFWSGNKFIFSTSK